MGFNLIYWTPMGGSYFFGGSNLEKYGIFLKNGRLWPDWGNTTRADSAGLGSIGLNTLQWELDKATCSNNIKDMSIFYCPPFIARTPTGSSSNLPSCTNFMHREVSRFSNFANANISL